MRMNYQFGGLKARVVACACAMVALLPVAARQRVLDMAQYGVRGGASPQVLHEGLRKALAEAKATQQADDTLTLMFSAGRYHFSPKYAEEVTCYISNHDQQSTPRRVALYLNGLNNVVIDGRGADFVCTGRMLPIAVAYCSNVTLKDLSIDFDNPHIAQAQIVRNDGGKGITFELSPEVHARVQDGRLITYGVDWEGTPAWGIVFERETKRIAYNTGDIGFNLTKDVKHLGDRRYHAPHWQDSRLAPGSVAVLRLWARPNPGIFLMNTTDVNIADVNIYYAEGMGVLAQACHNVSLTGSHVAMAEGSERYFSTQADATHFSGCSGKVTVAQCYFENMMDDALNVHGVYLKVTGRKNDRTLTARYMHEQAWGFEWGKVGEEVQFVDGQTVEVLGAPNTIARIRPLDKPTNLGVREFEITFKHKLDKQISPDKVIGIENLTRTPEVDFVANTVANNRARGILINTPKEVLVAKNSFNHVSGTAILFSTDCGQWWESGRTAKVTVRDNTFINALTSLYQFTDAVIAINPVVPQLDKQRTPFYGTGKAEDIRIVNNAFYTFDIPMIYAKSVNGMLVRDNKVERTLDFPRFHPNTQPTRYDKCLNIESQSMEATAKDATPMLIRQAANATQ